MVDGLSRRAALTLAAGTAVGWVGGSTSARTSARADGLAGPVGGPPGVLWRRTFTEDFAYRNAAELLATGRWHQGWFGDGRLTGPVNSAETAAYHLPQLTVAHGQVTFTARANTEGRAVPGSPPTPNLSAVINSDDYQAAIGVMVGSCYVEARLRQPAGDGVWPGWWLNGHEWPAGMEVDVLEGNGTDDGCSFNIHYGRHGIDTTNLNGIDRSRRVPGATSGMHAYAADITPAGVDFYYDGRRVYRFRGAVPSARRYLMVGLGTSGPALARPRSLVVDHVRVWQRS